MLAADRRDWTQLCVGRGRQNGQARRIDTIKDLRTRYGYVDPSNIFLPTRLPVSTKTSAYLNLPADDRFEVRLPKLLKRDAESVARSRAEKLFDTWATARQ